MSEIVRPAKAAARTRVSARAHCELDNWSFDPRYTEGRCPICGWTPPGAPSAPAWLVAARKFEWEITGLVLLLIVLVILGVVVARAAGYKLPVFNSDLPPAAATQVSPARTAHASPNPSHSPAHVTPRATPTH